MLTCKVGQKIVNTIDYDENKLRQWSNKGILKCPVCNSQMVYKNGEIKIAHFAHKNKEDCIYTFYENETKEHHLMKVYTYKWLKQLPLVKNLQLEYYIKETKQRPDIYFEMFDNKYVIELQANPITVKEYKKRHELYSLNNIIDIWILGFDNYNIQKNYILKKFKALQEYILKHNDWLYHLDVWNNKIIKYKKSVFEFGDAFFIQDINDINNFYIDIFGNIILNEQILKDFIYKYNSYKEYKINKTNKLLLEQQKLYNKTIKQIKIDRVNELIKFKKVKLYYNYDFMVHSHKNEKFIAMPKIKNTINDFIYYLERIPKFQKVVPIYVLHHTWIIDLIKNRRYDR